MNPEKQVAADNISVEHTNKEFFLKKQLSLTMIIRTLGVLIILGSGITLLLQEAVSWNQLGRFFGFQIFTVIVGTIGFILGKKFNEPKGSRALLGTTLALAPVIFCQLGGMLYASMNPNSVPSIDLPNMGKFVPESLLTVFFTTGYSAGFIYLFGLLLGLITLGTATNLLTVLYIVSNLLLMYPARHGEGLTYVLVAFLLVYIGQLFYFRPYGIRARTTDSVILKSIYALPFMFFLGRTILFYPAEITSVFLFIGYSITALSIFYFFKSSETLLPTIASTFFAALALETLYINILKLSYSFDAVFYFVFFGLVAGYALVLSNFVSTSVLKDKAQRFAYLLFILAYGFGCVFFDGYFVGILSIIGSILIVLDGLQNKSNPNLWIGILLGITALYRFLDGALELFSSYPWVSLGIVGIGMVVIASYLEKRKGVL